MAMLQSISGHTKCCRSGSGVKDYLLYGSSGTRDYLEKNNRALAQDFINLYTPNQQKHWDEMMDMVRHSSLNDKAYHGHKAITYRHFIISPDPNDHVDLETLRKLTTAWCEKEFGDKGTMGTYQVAITYHDDNSERTKKGLPGIPHAHIIVNNTDLITRNRLHFSNYECRQLSDDVQAIAYSMGLSVFNIEKVISDGKEVKTKKRTFELNETKRDVYRSKGARAAGKKGQVVWTDEIRNYITIACNCADTVEGVRDKLKEYGIVSTPRTKKGDYLFYYPNPKAKTLKDNKKRVSGTRLGRKFTNQGIKDQIKLSYYRKLEPEDRNENSITHLISNLQTVQIKDRSVTTLDISKAFAVISSEKIQTVSEAKESLVKHKRAIDILGKDSIDARGHKVQVDYLNALLRIADKTDLLPPDEHYAKTMPKDAKARIEQRNAQRKGKVSIETKVEKGWRLTKIEMRSLTSAQYREWLRNRKRIKSGKEVYKGGKTKQQRQKEQSSNEQSETKGKTIKEKKRQ